MKRANWHAWKEEVDAHEKAKMLLFVVQPSYALTVHKAQGSGYGRVFVDLDSIQRLLKSDIHAQKLMGWKLLYTAFTRAKKEVVLVTFRNTHTPSQGGVTQTPSAAPKVRMPTPQQQAAVYAAIYNLS